MTILDRAKSPSRDAWNQSYSKERLSEEWKPQEKTEFTVKKLTHEMDLPNLGLTEARLVNSVHLYSKIANFSAILDDLLLCRDYSTGLHRYLHVIRVEQRLIMQSVFDGDKIQVQGPKFHGLHPMFIRVWSELPGTMRK